MFVSIRTRIADLELTCAHASIDRIVQIEQNVKIGKLSVSADELANSRELHLKLMTTTSNLNSKVAVLRAERRCKRRLIAKLRKELTRKERGVISASISGTTKEVPITEEELVENAPENHDRYIKIISDLENKLHTLDHRLKTANALSSCPKTFAKHEECFSRILDILGPCRSHHSELNHQERQEIVNLLLSHA